MKMYPLILILFVAGSTLADSRWLPLAVGNSWTYEHHYLSDPDLQPWIEDSSWTTYIDSIGERQYAYFTVEVLRAEEENGETYYVFSDMPENWPPAPVPFVAGRKLRWSGSDLLELMESGEEAVFRFDGFAPEMHDEWGEVVALSYDYKDTIRVRAQEFLPGIKWFHFLSGSEHVTPSKILELMQLDFNIVPGLQNDQALIGPVVHFLYGFGVSSCDITVMRFEKVMFRNHIQVASGVIDGVETTYLDAYERAGELVTRELATGIAPGSWGLIKKESEP